MLELLILYIPTLIISSFSAATLGLIGSHILTQREGLRTFALSQQASFAILLTMMMSDHSAHTLQSIVAFILTIILCFIVILFEKKSQLRSDLWHLCIFIIFMAGNYFITTFFPALESHMARSFFGDLVTLSGPKLYILAFFIVLIAGYFIFDHKRIFSYTLKTSLHSNKINPLNFFNLITTFVITISILNLGLLFTLAMIFLPSCLSKNNSTNLRRHYTKIVYLSLASVILGLGCSLVFERVATVPAIILVLVLLSFLDNLRK